jgi:hypothetical protein
MKNLSKKNLRRLLGTEENILTVFASNSKLFALEIFYLIIFFIKM